MARTYGSTTVPIGFTIKNPGKTCRDCSMSLPPGTHAYWAGPKHIQCETCRDKSLDATITAYKGRSESSRSSSGSSTWQRQVEAYKSTHDTSTTEDKSSSHIYRRMFNSWQEWVDYATRGNESDAPRTRTRSDTKFTMTSSWSEAVSLARSGWTANNDLAISLADQIASHITTHLADRYIIQRNVVGGAVNVPLYLANDPASMLTVAPTKVSSLGRVIPIVISGVYAGAESTTTIIRRGAAIVALIDALERAQHSTEVWVEFSNPRSRTERLTYLIKIKDASEPLDIDTLMFAVAHPSSLRRLEFSAIELEPDHIKSKYIGGMGYTPSAVYESETVNAAISLGPLDYSFAKGDNAAAQWILFHLINAGLIESETL